MCCEHFHILLRFSMHRNQHSRTQDEKKTREGAHAGVQTRRHTIFISYRWYNAITILIFCWVVFQWTNPFEAPNWIIKILSNNTETKCKRSESNSQYPLKSKWFHFVLITPRHTYTHARARTRKKENYQKWFCVLSLCTKNENRINHLALIHWKWYGRRCVLRACACIIAFKYFAYRWYFNAAWYYIFLEG